MSNTIVCEGNTTAQAHLTCLFELILALQEYEISVYSHKMNPNCVSHYQYMMGPTYMYKHVLCNLVWQIWANCYTSIVICQFYVYTVSIVATPIIKFMHSLPSKKATFIVILDTVFVCSKNSKTSGDMVMSKILIEKMKEKI